MFGTGSVQPLKNCNLINYFTQPFRVRKRQFGTKPVFKSTLSDIIFSQLPPINT
jgi:hypothetical protein